MSNTVLDASAILLALKGEPGTQTVLAALEGGAVVGALNLSEVIAKLAEWGMDEPSIRAALGGLDMQVVDFDAELAFLAGMLRGRTRRSGLGLGDRACIALAQRLGAAALTADRAWGSLKLDVPIELAR